MNTWRYVACRHFGGHGEVAWDVRELYRTNPGEPLVYTEHAMRPFGESLEELQRDLSRMHSDVSRGDLPYLDVTSGEAVMVA